MNSIEIVSCPSCKKKIVVEPGEHIDSCPYCKNVLIIGQITNNNINVYNITNKSENEKTIRSAIAKIIENDPGSFGLIVLIIILLTFILIIINSL